MHDGYKANDSFEKVLQTFPQPDSKYAPYVFWFYDEDLTKVGIKPQEMAHELAKKGFNPGYAHARINYAKTFLKTDDEHIVPLPKEQWLSEEWFSVLEKQALQAARDTVYASYADDYGWPSLQAAGRLVENDPTLRSQNLRYRYMDLEAGDTVSLEGCFFAVAGKRICTEPTSYAEYDAIEKWTWTRASYDQSPPEVNNSLPLNMASAWSDAPDAACTFHIRIPDDGTYRFYSCWYGDNNNTPDAVYTIDGQAFHADQRQNAFQWNLLGDVYLSAGMHTVILQNGNTGRLSADAIKAISENGTEIIVDDNQTTNRQIAYLDSDSLTVLDTDTFTAAEACRVYLFEKQIHRGYDGSTIDYLQKRVSDLFLETAWNPCVEKLGSFMGSNRPINGIFSDHEGDYGYKLAWSEDLRELFEAKYAEDIRRILPLLIDRDIQGQDVVWRFHWFDTVSDLYAEHFHKMSDAAARQDIYYTLHTWEESLQLQAACTGDVFKLNRRISLPGTDALQCVAYNPLNFKDIFSITEFEGTRFMNEVMALNGHARYTPEELKKQANYLAAYGVSHVINHAVKMTRKHAQSVVTPDFYNIDPCWQSMRQYTDFIRRTSYINSLGYAAADVLLLNPMDSMYALAENDVFDMNYEMLDVKGGIPKICASFGGEAGEINRQYGEIIRILTRQRIEHLTADKEYLYRMEVSGNCLCYKEYCFHTVVVPRSTMLDLPVVQKLTEFARNGGTIYWIGPVPTATLQNGRKDPALADCISALQRTPSVHFLRNPDELHLESNIRTEGAAGTILSHWRRIEDRDFLFLCSNTGQSETFTVHLPGMGGRVLRLNPATGERQEIYAEQDEKGLHISLQFAPYEACYLVIDSAEKGKACPETKVLSHEIPLSAFLVNIDRGNTEKTTRHIIPKTCTSRIRMVCRKGCFEDPYHPDVSEIEILCAGKNILQEKVQRTFDTAYDACGEIIVSFPEQEIDEIRIHSEKGLTSYRIETWAEPWWQEAAELDTYSQNEIINPVEYFRETREVSLTDWENWDFLSERFAGVITYTGTAVLSETDLQKKAILDLGYFSGSVQVFVNNTFAGSKMFPPFRFSLDGYLTAGENRIVLLVSNTIVSNVSHTHGGIKQASIKFFM